jgi:hypothetical protein
VLIRSHPHGTYSHTPSPTPPTSVTTSSSGTAIDGRQTCIRMRICRPRPRSIIQRQCHCITSTTPSDTRVVDTLSRDSGISDVDVDIIAPYSPSGPCSPSHDAHDASSMPPPCVSGTQVYSFALTRMVLTPVPPHPHHPLPTLLHLRVRS